MRLPGSPYTWMELVLHGLADLLTLLGRAVSGRNHPQRHPRRLMLERTSDEDEEDEEED